MDFYRFDNCVISNRPLNEYFRLGPWISIVFLRQFKNLPLIGYSLYSAEDIIERNMGPNDVVAYRSWESSEFAGIAECSVQKGDYIKINLILEEKRMGVRYRMNVSAAPTEIQFFNFPPSDETTHLVFLAISSPQLFNEKSKTCEIVVLNASEMIKWAGMKKAEKARIKSASVGYIPTSGIQKQSNAEPPGIPKCIMCWENEIDTLLLPCCHAICCEECKGKYVETVKSSRRFVTNPSDPTDILCPVCRKKVENVAKVWFPPKPQCLLCTDGCHELTAVAGGLRGCGCIIGCYSNALKLKKAGGFCPNCNEKIVDILQIFLQSDQD